MKKKHTLPKFTINYKKGLKLLPEYGETFSCLCGKTHKMTKIAEEGDRLDCLWYLGTLKQRLFLEQYREMIKNNKKAVYHE